MTLNIYNEKLADTFKKTDVKPDKQFSFLPTVMSVIGEISNKTILDLGCGDGFFTIPLANSGAKQVIGIDNSKEQIRLAKKKTHPQNITYVLGDIFTNHLPSADIVLAPFVINYAQSINDLKILFKNIYASLRFKGKIVLVVDLPKGKNLKKFGSIKTLLGPVKDETEIKIDLYDGGNFICTLFSYYYTPQTLETILTETGFLNIKWYKPIVSKEGLKKFGKNFWKRFAIDSELGYLSAEK